MPIVGSLDLDRWSFDYNYNHLLAVGISQIPVIVDSFPLVSNINQRNKGTIMGNKIIQSPSPVAVKLN